MRRWILLFCFASIAGRAATYTLTMKQAVDKALAQNPEIIMARTDELKAQASIHVARDPFVPRIGVGSGLAYSNGFPLSIEGSAPAAFQARANQYLINQPQRYQLKEAEQNARTAGYATGMKQEEIAFRVGSLYLDVDRSNRLADVAGKQVEALAKILETVQSRVEEGRALPVEAKEANVNLLRAKARFQTLEGDRDFSSRNLAVILGYSANDIVRVSDQERESLAIPPNEQAAVDAALASNKDLKRLESTFAAKVFEIKGVRAQRLPRVDLVAQYALLTRYSHYDEYFNKFQRNNGQLGASFQVPFLLGPGVKALVAQAEADQQHIRSEMTLRRNQITLEIHQSYQDLEKAETARQLAQADLDLVRSQLSLVLAQLNEGRATLKQVEETRFNENEKWIAFYDAQFNGERTRLNVLRQTGELSAALR